MHNNLEHHYEGDASVLGQHQPEQTAQTITHMHVSVIDEKTRLMQIIEQYLEDFANISDGWNTTPITAAQGMLKAANRIQETGAINRLIHAADVAICAAIYAHHTGCDFDQLIIERLKNNLDKADRASIAAEVKDTCTCEEWRTTQRKAINWDELKYREETEQ